MTRIFFIAILVNFFLVSSLFGARRTACDCTSSPDPCCGTDLWWESLIDLPFTINAYADSWPADIGTLDEQTEFEEKIVSSFNTWESTGMVSFSRESNITNIDPNAACAYGTQGACDGDASCTWTSGACYRDVLLYHSGERNTISNIKTGDWPASYGAGTLAITQVFYNSSTGQILEADLLVNDKNFDFDGADNASAYSLQGILTHEIGHVLGIAHPCSIDQANEPWTQCSETGGIYEDATMYPQAQANDDTKLITLEMDDYTALQMVCSDPKTRCHNEDLYGEVKVEQGGGCFRVETVSSNRKYPPFLMILPIALIVILIRREKRLFSKR